MTRTHESCHELHVSDIDIAVVIDIRRGARALLRALSDALPDKREIDGVDAAIAVHIGTRRNAGDSGARGTGFQQRDCGDNTDNASDTGPHAIRLSVTFLPQAPVLVLSP